MESKLLFAEIILPLALKGSFTYALPPELIGSVKIGSRVLVQFGKKKLYSGIVYALHDKKPEHFEAKAILSVLDEGPLLSEAHLQFWNWISGYYMCYPGEVMTAALPQGLKLQSESKLLVVDTFDNGFELNPAELNMLEFIKDEQLEDLEAVRKSPFGVAGIKLVNSLIEKGALTTDQYFRRAYKARKIKCIDIAEDYQEEKKLGELIDSLKRSPSQAKALLEYARLSGRYSDPEALREVLRSDMSGAGVPAHAIQGLKKKGVLVEYEIQASRIHHADAGDDNAEPVSLSEHQEEALDKIRSCFKRLPVVMLHGITSSGKTEIYIHLIEEQIKKGKQVLYLLPEIALTSQIIKRLKRHFGSKVGVYHSKYSDNERVEVFRNISGLTEQAPFSVILGVRSAIYLPFRDLGMVIVDEEHENTYKQFDPAPRYHARDAVTMLGMFSGAKILMGSATPSFESFHNSAQEKYGLVLLQERYGKVALPEVIIADVKQARKRKQLKAHFTPELIAGIKETLENGQQVILFQNRRGYSNYLQCEKCSYILKCKSCDVSLTYHKYNKEMVCHYCGFKMPVMHQCPDCKDQTLSMRGFGTEKIEDEIGKLFPEARVGRLDVDKTRSRKAFEKLIHDFELGKLDILVGTQMVTKGLDFENVSLVGVIDADSMLNFPDFRAFERSFQLMVQVSGRAGRREKRGKVIIQTMDVDHPVIKRVLANEFSPFYSEQLAERKMFSYPPYVRLVKLTLRHEIPSILDGGSIFLANELREIFGSRVLGPQQPVVARTHGKYIKQILIKIEKDASYERAKKLISELLEVFALNPVYKQIRTIVDVDPL